MKLIYLPQAGDRYICTAGGGIVKAGKILWIHDPHFDELLEYRFSGGWSIDLKYQDPAEDEYKESEPFTEVFHPFKWNGGAKRWSL